MSQKRVVGALLAAALAVAGCVATSVRPSVTAPQAAPSSGAAAAPAAAGAKVQHRVVHVVADPKTADHVQKVARYWDYGQDAPFAVANYTAAASAAPGPKNAHETKLTAMVTLPTRGAKKWKVLNEEAAAVDAAFDEDVPQNDAATPSDGASADPSAHSPADEMDSVDPEAASADEAGPDVSFPPAKEAATHMTGPHEVDVTVEDQPFMSNQDDTVLVTDKATGQSFTVSYDQEWRHYVVQDDVNKLTFEFNPDGTYLVDGKPAAHLKDAVALMEKSPVVANASRYCIAMLVARIARLASEVKRAPAQAVNGLYRVIDAPGSYRILSASASAQARAYVLTDSLLKHLLKAAP